MNKSILLHNPTALLPPSFPLSASLAILIISACTSTPSQALSISSLFGLGKSTHKNQHISLIPTQPTSEFHNSPTSTISQSSLLRPLTSPSTLSQAATPTPSTPPSLSLQLPAHPSLQNAYPHALIHIARLRPCSYPKQVGAYFASVFAQGGR